MTKRILLSYLTITLIVLLMLGIPLGLFFAQRERERLAADVAHDATVIATLYEDDLEARSPLDPTAANTYEVRTGARVVIVDSDGIAQVDTAGVVNRDFSTRPEFEAALNGEVTSGTRSSETLGTDLLYVAVPVASGGTVHGALRVSLDTSDVTRRIRAFWFALIAVGAVVLLAVAAIGWVIARSVTRPLRELTDTAARFASGDLAVSESTRDGPPEIQALEVTMSTMARRLDGVLSRQRAFVSDASHQLRTPLTALRLRLENLQSALGSDTGRFDVADREVERAIDETNRLTELVSSLLQLARADERPATTSVDLGRLVVDRVDTWTAVAEELSVGLIGPDEAGTPIMVDAVPGAIEQVLDNLLDNALGKSTTGSAVEVLLEVSAEVGSRHARLQIVDHGAGMSDEQKANATGRFWRGDTTVPGTGLGLAIVDALVGASGGTLTLFDTPGGGLTVLVELPIF